MNVKVKKDYVYFKKIEQKFLNYCADLIEKNKNNHSIINAIKKTETKFFYIKKIILNAVKNNLSYCQSLKIDNESAKQKHKKPIYKKSTFYQYLKDLKLIFLKINLKQNFHPTETTFSSIINQPPIPKHPKHKLTNENIRKITNEYYEFKDWKLNRLNVWNKLNKQIPTSYKTICKYIKLDERNLKNSLNTFKPKHPLRKWNIDVGKIQLDVKVIGPKETKFKKYIYIMDAKDEQSKLYWAKIIVKQTKTEMIAGLKECIEFFHNHKITVKRIRTDNAMVFKKTNFVKSSEFNNICEENNIIHEFIPKRQPECNGVIERQHKNIDEEFKQIIDKLNNEQQIIHKFNNYQHYFNYERKHIYTYMQKQNIDYIFTPIEWLEKYYY